MSLTIAKGETATRASREDEPGHGATPAPRASVETPVTVPGAPEPLGLWRSYRAARRNVLEIIPAASYAERAVVNPKTNAIVLTDPEAIERVLRSAAENYPRSIVGQRMMSSRRGHNIVSASGATWRNHRRALSPLFTPRVLAAHAGTMTAAAERASDAVAGDHGGVCDVFPITMAATRDVICELAFSAGEGFDKAAFARAIDDGIRTVTRFSILDLLRVPNFIPRPGSILSNSRKRLDAMADTIVDARRRRGPSDPPDFLDHLLASEDTEGGLSALEIRNNVIAMLFAGHETTALALAWSLYLLALDEAVQDEAAATSRAVLGARAATGEDLAALAPVRAIVEEALRLYPPGAVLSRMAREDDTLAGIPVAARTTVLIAVYALHRHPDFWQQPERFDPARFTPQARAARPRFSYLPFGAGPRICVGAEFALMEATIILSTLLARHRFRLVPGVRPVPRMWFTLRPANGMPLAVTPRH